MARCTRKCSVAGAASSDVTVHCSPRGTQHHGSWPLRGATTFLRLLYEPFLTRFILSFFPLLLLLLLPPPPSRLLFPLFLLSALSVFAQERDKEGRRVARTRCELFGRGEIFGRELRGILYRERGLNLRYTLFEKRFF